MEPQQHQAVEERRNHSLGFFEGPIADALALARQSPGLVLVVSLQEEGHEQAEPVGDHGSTGVEASRRLNAETWSHPDVACRLKEATVALRLDWRSPDGVSFLAIYPAFQVPTIYLIAPLTGQPLGILVGHVTPQQFLAKLDECSAALASLSPVVPAPAFSTTDAPPPHEPAAATITAAPQRPTGEDEQRANDTEQHHSPPDASPGSRPLSPAEVAAQKEQLLKRLEQAKRQKEAQEKEAERERELARRRDGKAALETLKTIEEINKRKEIEQRRREKSEAERHKALVREKIRRDRELRAQQQQQQQAVSPSSAATNAPPVPEAPSSAPPTAAAIAFRMPDGSLEKADFAATSTLADCRKHLRTVVGLQGHFGLMTNFPRHVFTEDEYSCTLRALQLCPSATLIVTGATEHASSGDGPAVRGAEGAGFISYLWSFFGGSSSSAPSSGTLDHDYPQQQQATAPSSRQPLGRAGGSGAGNVHGLRRDDDMAEDADNAYWNGNSTQQY